ncbi:protein LEAD-SENSITIVE 1-like [Telopea speciosissima]|uniref:protein LEAD-SENSITIVE 1-like n=1 Tax=Telopea speciosissima TaxID=54955 RepID=UPI001CC7DB9B|nr:protein LEAD-SENSITIVE 1-like [Telopea speciosissima]
MTTTTTVPPFSPLGERRRDKEILVYYGVMPSAFVAKIWGGTCTTATSDPPETVIHRAMYLLQNGFGNYDVFQNNCEDFALYCKTGLLVHDSESVVGRSGQASSFIGAPLAALLSSPLKLLMPGLVGVATAAAGMYCASRYATDIGVRTDVVKVAVEDMAVKLVRHDPDRQLSTEESSIIDPTESTRPCHSKLTKVIMNPLCLGLKKLHAV